MPLAHYTPKTKPFKHQEEELTNHWRDPSRAILWEQGTGKTKEAIDQACALYAAGLVDAVVVAAPNGVHRNWVSDEIPAHVPDEILAQCAHHAWRNQSASTKWHQAAVEKVLKHPGFSWLVMSYDAIMTNGGRDALWRFLKKRRVIYIVDESHNIKSPSAKRTIRIVSSGRYAAYRRVLSGTPVAQGPFDIYSQLKFLDEEFWDRNGFSSYNAFKTHFGVWFTAADCKEVHGYDPGYDKLLGYRNLDQLQKILSSVSTRVLKEEVLDLPPKLYTKRYYELTKEQVRLYEALKEDYLVETLSGKLVEAPLAIVRLLRFQQICNGYVGVEGDEEPTELIPGGNPLLDALGEWTETLGERKTIIWARFTKDIDLIMELLGSKGGQAVRYDGTITDEEAFDNSERFKRGDAQFIVANPSKGKEGLTWNMAWHVGYYSNSFKLLDRLQSEDRAHRIGLDHPVDYTDFIAQYTIGDKTHDTVVSHIVRSLRNKYDIASQITGDELKDWI